MFNYPYKQFLLEPQGALHLGVKAELQLIFPESGQGY
jgi:hypothetical protein